MAQVDPDDDSRSRWVVYRYRYDPARQQRRNVVIEAVESEQDMHQAVERALLQLDAERRAGTAEPQERVFADHRQAGHLERVGQARRRPSHRLTATRTSDES